MAFRKISFAPEEWYHCYTRSIDGAKTFISKKDFERFVEALYLCNDVDLIPRSNFKHLEHKKILERSRGKSLVSIGAYCLMPNHFHLLLREEVEGGISKFMQRVGTSYAKYFNLKYDHVGNVFIKPFRSKHIADDQYLKRVVEYIHLNPAEIFEQGWKEGAVKNMKVLYKQLSTYPYSSFQEFVGIERPENALIEIRMIEILKNEEKLSLDELLNERTAYYADLENPRSDASGI